MHVLYVLPHPPTSTTSGGAQRSARLRLVLGSADTVYLPSTPSERAVPPVPAPAAEASRSWHLSYSKIERDFSKGLGIGSFPPIGKGLHAFALAGRHRWAPYQPLIATVGDLSRFDLVVARYLSSACILDLFRHPRLLIDVDDYDPDRLRQRIASCNWFQNLTLRRCLRFSEAAHRNLLPRAAHCWVSNPGDRRHPGLANATLLPNIPYFPAGLPAPALPPAADLPPVFLVVGTLSYSANSDGIDAFLREAWPSLRDQAPTAELHIVGQGLSSVQRTRWSRFPGARAIGFVENLADSYARCTATIAPILAGGGTNIKVLESCAYGRPCVVSRVAHRGFEQTLPAGEACLRAETIGEMAYACLRLLREPALAARIGARGREAIETHYTPAVFAAAVNAGIHKVLQGRSPA